MDSTLKPKQTDDPHDVLVVAPDAARVAPDPVQVAPADEELSKLLRDAARQLSDPQTHTASDLPAGPAVPPVPPVDTPFRPAAVNNVHIPGYRRWIGGGGVPRFPLRWLAAGARGSACGVRSTAARK